MGAVIGRYSPPDASSQLDLMPIIKAEIVFVSDGPCVGDNPLGGRFAPERYRPNFSSLVRVSSNTARANVLDRVVVET